MHVSQSRLLWPFSAELYTTSPLFQSRDLKTSLNNKDRSVVSCRLVIKTLNTLFVLGLNVKEPSIRTAKQPPWYEMRRINQHLTKRDDLVNKSRPEAALTLREKGSKQLSRTIVRHFTVADKTGLPCPQLPAVRRPN